MSGADPYSLDRFVEAQTLAHQTALAELRCRAKRTHWMSFVFPQLAGLGHSSRRGVSRFDCSMRPAPISIIQCWGRASSNA